MGQPLTTDNIGDYFAEAFKEVAMPAFENLTNKVEGLESEMKDVKKRLSGVEERLGNVEEGLKEVKEDITTKEDLKKLEITLTKRMDRMSDVQSNLNERVETLESQSPIAFA